MLADVYTYGHLVLGPVSLVMAIAFAVIALRVPGSRRDFGFAVIFTVATVVTFVQFGMVQRGTVVWARLYVVSVYVLHAVTVALIHVMYGRRRGRAIVVGYVVFCAVGIALLLAGVGLTGVRTVEFLGVRAPMLRGGAVHIAFNMLALGGGELLAIWLLAGPGPRRQERALFMVPIALAPLAVIHEQLITLGWIDSLPLGGYFVALTGLVGAWILADRIRGAGNEPRQLAGFEVVKRLGAGGLAVVWQATRRGTGEMGSVTQVVALKRLRPEMAEDPRFVKMFLEEARLAARLRHPNIVSLLEAGSTDHGVYLAMELVEGPSLARVLELIVERGEPPERAAVVEIGAQLADALAYAHELDHEGRALQIVHRDVSPQNVLIARTGHVKLADFGIARTVEQTTHTQTGVIKGKIRYMAPEQIRGDAYDHRVDIYALAVILLELAAARHRFADRTDVQVLYKIVEGGDTEPLLDAIDPELAAVLRRALAPDPARRTPTAAAFLADLAPLRSPAEGVAALARLATAVGADPVSLPFEETQVA